MEEKYDITQIQGGSPYDLSCASVTATYLDMVNSLIAQMDRAIIDREMATGKVCIGVITSLPWGFKIVTTDQPAPVRCKWHRLIANDSRCGLCGQPACPLCLHLDMTWMGQPICFKCVVEQQERNKDSAQHQHL